MLCVARLRKRRAGSKRIGAVWSLADCWTIHPRCMRSWLWAVRNLSVGALWCPHVSCECICVDLLSTIGNSASG